VAKAASSWRGAFRDDQEEEGPAPKPTGAAGTAKALWEESRWLVRRTRRTVGGCLARQRRQNIDGVTAVL
jgi:hypothetical protein